MALWHYGAVMRLREPDRRIHLVGAAGLVALLFALGWWMTSGDPLEPPTQPVQVVVLPLPGGSAGPEREPGPTRPLVSQEVLAWRNEFAANLPTLDQACAHLETTTMACEGQLCAFRHRWGVRGSDSVLERFRRSPRAFLENVAVSVGWPKEATHCGRASLNIPWRPVNLGPGYAVPPDDHDLAAQPSCWVMGFDWVEAADGGEVEHAAVRLCNALAEHAGAPPTYSVAPIYERR